MESQKTTTKLKKILIERSIKQKDFQKLISITIKKNKLFLKTPPLSTISQISSGKKKNYDINLAKLIALTLDVKIDDIVENSFSHLKKE